MEWIDRTQKCCFLKNKRLTYFDLIGSQTAGIIVEKISIVHIDSSINIAKWHCDTGEIYQAMIMLLNYICYPRIHYTEKGYYLIIICE